MERYFNTEGLCHPERHYMVRLDERSAKIKRRYVDRGSYFVINKGRQYGKTTMLRALEGYLKKDYIVLSMDFQELGSAGFRDEAAFTEAFSGMTIEAFAATGIGAAEMEEVRTLLGPMAGLEKRGEGIRVHLMGLFGRLSVICGHAPKPVVMMIDEVDSASNNQVFIDFLALLRRYYLDRDKSPIFHSVILAGVYDIKNLKLKYRAEDEHRYNSPWNIAAEFNIEMDFSADQIGAMLEEYEADHFTGMDIRKVSASIYAYTSGQPYLVSAICKLLDEELTEESLQEDEGTEAAKSLWTAEGVAKAANILIGKKTTLSESMVKQLDLYQELRDMIEGILYQGKQIPYSPHVHAVDLGVMFGFLQEEKGHVAIHNRIFEMILMNMFITEEAAKSEAFRYGDRDKSQFVKEGHLDMELVLERFADHYTDIYGDNDERFIEKYGRKFFLLYLKPIINGTGNYYIEAQTRDARRTDVVVDYLGEQFVLEMKIWHGNEYNERGEKQLVDYLDYFHLDKGYMLSFNFNKNKQVGVKKMQVRGRTLIEAVV